MNVLIPEPEARNENADWRPHRVAPVVLAGGQTWYLPRPCVGLLPVFVSDPPYVEPEADPFAAFRRQAAPDRTVRCVEVFPMPPSYGHPVGRLVEALAAETDPAEVVRRVLTIAGLLMRTIYFLNDEELGSILAFSSDDPAAGQMIKDIVAIIVGKETHHGIA